MLSCRDPRIHCAGGGKQVVGRYPADPYLRLDGVIGCKPVERILRDGERSRCRAILQLAFERPLLFELLRAGRDQVTTGDDASL